MSKTCPRCRSTLLASARFCAQCGLRLSEDAGGLVGARALEHPHPLAPPAGFQPCPGAADLFYAWSPEWGGHMLLGTEPLNVLLFNAGYALADVAVRITGIDELGNGVMSKEHEVESLARGATATIEIPSYDLPDRIRKIEVELVRAAFGPADE